VSLTITDANGLSATATRAVTAPGPPTVAFTAARVGTSRTFALHDTSRPGLGGAAVVGWLWGFGDPRSAADTSRQQNPQHTFTAPGSYQVCLIITDANGRHSGVCQPVVVPAAAAQASKRTVASTALSSPMSWAGRRRAGETTA
jgi:PKD repeat protein